MFFFVQEIPGEGVSDNDHKQMRCLDQNTNVRDGRGGLDFQALSAGAGCTFLKCFTQTKLCLPFEQYNQILE